MRKQGLLTGSRVPALTVEARLTGATAELMIFDELDPARTSVLADMLALVLGKHPRNLVVGMSGPGSVDRAAARVITEAVRLLPAAARPVIYWVSVPAEPSEAAMVARPRVTVECGMAQAPPVKRHHGDGAGRSRAG